MRVLLTTTSFQDTPGSFHDLPASKGYELIRERAFGMMPLGYDIYWDAAFAARHGVQCAATF